MRRTLPTFLVLAAFLLFALPALAGGWATVRLDEPPGDLPAGQPWQFGFMVMQHDTTPNSDVTPVVRAVHLETGEEVTAAARQDGPTGHFVAELTLPEAGEWRWTVTPEPFAETSFPALIVRDQQADAPSINSANLIAGTCTEPGEVTQSLGEIDVTPDSASQLTMTETTIDLPLRELTGAPHAILIGDSASETSHLACGEISGSLEEDELAIPLQPLGSSGQAGLVLIRPEADRAAATLYLFNFNSQDTLSAPAGPTETITMLQDWRFAPTNLSVTPGTTVTWVNDSTIVHAVALDDPRQTASGLIEPGQTFSYTFNSPGTFRYHCSPHPGMKGTVTVKG
jgi:plastocyanin